MTVFSIYTSFRTLRIISKMHIFQKFPMNLINNSFTFTANIVYELFSEKNNLLVAHSATQYISLFVCLSVCSSHFFKFKQFYSLYWHILFYFSSVELSDPLAQIPWFRLYAFYEASINFLVLLSSLSLAKSQSRSG